MIQERKETKAELENKVSLVTEVKLVNLDFLEMMVPPDLLALPVSGVQLAPLDLQEAQWSLLSEFQEYREGGVRKDLPEKMALLVCPGNRALLAPREFAD